MPARSTSAGEWVTLARRAAMPSGTPRGHLFATRVLMWRDPEGGWWRAWRGQNQISIPADIGEDLLLAVGGVPLDHDHIALKGISLPAAFFPIWAIPAWSGEPKKVKATEAPDVDPPIRARRSPKKSGAWKLVRLMSKERHGRNS